MVGDLFVACCMKEGILISTRGDRLSALDGLRGLAALLVVFFHVGWPNHLTNNNFVRNGYLAVDLFFILSGYIIFRNYAARIGTLNELGKFICLRFFRVYPLHIVVLAFLVCIELTKLVVQSGLSTSSEQAPFTNGNSISALVANILLVQGMHVVNELSWNIPSWTISCEFAAYLVFGTLALTGIFRLRSFLPCVCLVAAGAYLVLGLERDGLDVTYDWGAVRCLAGFSFGALVVQLSSSGASRFHVFFRFAAVVVLVAIVSVTSIAKGSAVVFVIPLFVIVVALLQSDSGPAARILMHRSIQYLGRVSYSIYMVQYVTILCVTIVMKRIFKVPVSTDPQTQKFIMMIDPWVGDALVLGCVFAVVLIAGFTNKWVENPGRALGRHLASVGF
jgi:peptidoglycan/LPS O-acetylase OafA/YrhL